MPEEADVVVLGSGGGALSAALTASVGGAEVTVLEVAPVFGGTTAISGGGMWLPCNPHDPNWHDSVEDAKTYLKRLTLGFVSDAVLDRFIAESATVTTYFSEHTPLTFAADVGRPDYQALLEGGSLTSRTVFPGPYELPRLGDYAAKVRMPPGGGIRPIQHWEERPGGDVATGAALEAVEALVADRIARGVVLRGRALIGGLMEGCLANNATFVANTRARSLITEGGRVVGVRAEQDGREVEYRARFGVVIATGGFEWNRELWDNFMAVPYDGPASPPWNRGDGLIMAAEVGAKLGCLDKAIWTPSSNLGEIYDGKPRVTGRQNGQMPGEILVNRQGRRFVNECVPYNDIGRAYMQFDPDPQTYDFANYPFYAIGDKHGLAALESRYTPTSGDGWVVGETIHEVGEKLGIDADALVEQVEEWNKDAANGVDSVFHRGETPWEVHMLPNHKTIGPIVEGPFFGHRARGGVFGTRGGPVVNENAQIVDYSDRPIPGLYGAGNAIAAPLAHTYPGGGGTVGPAVVFGHIAGKSILKDNGR